MGDVHTDKIVGVAQNGKTMNVWWTNNATEIYWNNAIIMASSIARTISTGTLWDGFLHFTEKIPSTYFIEKVWGKCSLGDITDTLTFNHEEPINFSFAESVPAFIENEWQSMSIATITDDMPALVANILEVGNLSNTEVYFELANPIKATDAELTASLSAFTVYGIYATGRLEFTPTAITRLGQSEFKLTVSSLAGATGDVGIIYDSSKGYLYDCVKNEKVADFSKAFTFTETETQDE